MSTIDLPLSQTNPEAARQLTLSTYYLRKQDFRRATDYARLPSLVGDAQGVLNLLTTLVLRREYTAAIEMAGILLKVPMHHTAKRTFLDAVLPALYHSGAMAGDCSEAYATAHELAGHANLNPEHPRWAGQPLRGKTLLVSLSEAGLGGFGDHIMWARFLPLVAEYGPRIIVQCPQPLGRLFQTIPGVVSTCNYEERPVCDFAVSIMELPHVLGVRGVPTLNPFQVSAVPLPEETHNIAINWGASWAAPYMDRSCALAEYMPLMQLPRTAFYAVQKGAHQKQLYPPPVGFQAYDVAPNLDDFLDTARVLASMDAVVTTDNVVGNLACSLGLPTFVLVPKCADWRWGDRGQSPWYPSARVYQQEVAGEWQQPIERLVNDLGAFLHRVARRLPIPSQNLAAEEPVSTQSAHVEADQQAPAPEPKTAESATEAA